MNIAKVGVMIAALSFCLNCQSFSCRPFFDETVFSYQYHPDLPLKFFFIELGVIEPSFARSYLFATYRDLSGKTLSSRARSPLLKVWKSRMTNADAVVGYAGAGMETG
ncbi:MAG: hypothetical protein U0103_11495 [Candidatus Obscuribacterales bacterium]